LKRSAVLIALTVVGLAAIAGCGDSGENLLITRYLLGRLDASASAEEGDVVADAELLWAPEAPG
jgi:hypothetical protein